MTNQIPVRQNDQKKSPSHASPAGGRPRIFYFPASEVGQVLQEVFPLPFPLGRWSAMPFRLTLGRLSLTSRPERVARGTLGEVPLPFPRGTRSGVLPPFHGLIIAPAGAFVKTFFIFFFRWGLGLSSPRPRRGFSTPPPAGWASLWRSFSSWFPRPVLWGTKPRRARSCGTGCI